jgi:SAM-dependent methyltransferase
MYEKEAHEYLAQRLGLEPELIKYFVELQRDKVIINPMLSDTALKIGRLLNLRPDNTVLDLACGKAGVSLSLVMAYKIRLMGVDVLPEFAREASMRAEATGLYDLATFISEDAKIFAEETNSQWDAVMMMGASFIWGGLLGALRVLPGLVKPGGTLVIGEPYFKPDAANSPDMPFSGKEQTTQAISEIGEIVEVFDDGDEGWEAYYGPEEKIRKRLLEDHPDNHGLKDMLDKHVENMEWEMKNLGWAAWVVRIG